MSFLVRILFSGLIAMVPSEDGKELTVLLLNVDQAHHTSDGSTLQHHDPLLVVRAGGCSGNCTPRDSAVAKAMFLDKSDVAGRDALEASTTSNGSAWLLAGSDLSIRKGSSGDPDLPPLVLRTGLRNGIIPTTATEREDSSWIADLDQICPTGCDLNPAVLGSQPPPGLVAARLRLRTGDVFTYSVARIGANVTPVHFKRLDGTGSVSPYTQAVASWVGADIQVAGDSIEIVEAQFDGDPGRSMILTPDATGKVEMAVLNLPPFVPPASPNNDAPQVGKHFEAFYELSQTPPARETRLVPRPGAAPGAPSYATVDWQLVHPQNVVHSELLNKLRLDIGRTMYDRVLCPPAIDPQP